MFRHSWARSSLRRPQSRYVYMVGGGNESSSAAERDHLEANVVQGQLNPRLTEYFFLPHSCVRRVAAIRRTIMHSDAGDQCDSKKRTLHIFLRSLVTC